MVVKSRGEIWAVGIADHDEFLWDRLVFHQPLLIALEKDLAPLVEDEKIGAGIVAVIGHHEIDQIAQANTAKQAEFSVIDVGTHPVVVKTLILAVAARLNGVF